MKNFWNNQTKKNISPISMGNLEENKILLKKKINLEKKKVNKFIKNIEKEMVLDLECGTGTWSIFFSKFKKNKTIYAVDYSKSMLNIAKIISKKYRKKIKFFNMSAEKFIKNKKFDLIWISGLLIYLNDRNFQKLMDNCKKMLKSNGTIIVRDGTAKKKKFVLNKKFSFELNGLYSAQYRTIKEYKKKFSKNFKVIKDEDMFPKNSTLNKRKETILRIYKLKHYEKI